MRLVLLNPPILQESLYGAVAAAAPLLPPLGLASLAAEALRQGHEVLVVDGLALGLDDAGAAAAVLAARPDLVGVTTTTIAVSRAAAVAARIRAAAPGLPILVGGAHPTAMPAETLDRVPAFDAAVIGEGEMTLVDVMDRLSRGESLAGTPGLAWRAGSAVEIGPDRPAIRDLDSLDRPAWRLLPDLVRVYRPSAFGFLRLPSTYAVVSRGCPGRCTFCAYQYWGRRYRTHGVEWTIEYLRDLMSAGIRDVSFSDGIFGAKRSWMEAFCEAVLQAGLDLSWSCNLRIDTADVRLLSLMHRAGCWGVAYGIESGSARVLENIHKGITPDEAARSLRAARSAGLVTKGYFMVGLPGETAETLAESERFVLEADLDLLTVNHFVPYPGTEDWDRADEWGVANRDWEQSSEHRPSFVPRGLTVRELVEARRRMVRRFYLRPIVMGRVLRLAANPQALPLLFRGAMGLGRLLLPR